MAVWPPLIGCGSVTGILHVSQSIMVGVPKGKRRLIEQSPIGSHALAELFGLPAIERRAKLVQSIEWNVAAHLLETDRRHAVAVTALPDRPSRFARHRCSNRGRY
jgi:hypothetical protein